MAVLDRDLTMDEPLPRLFGPYLLVEKLAEGGMGEVFLAKHRVQGGGEDFCVIKRLLPKLTRDREYVTRFVDEARVVVTLDHPSISEIFDVGRVDKHYYLAMEYVPGLDLRTILERAEHENSVLSPPTALHIACELLSALDYAHKRRHPITDEPLELVHRDISPHNVIVGFDNRVILIDFGLASSRLKIEKTEPNIVMGKMAYMAPEQARADATTGKSDQFAVAVLLYEMLTGERFYATMNPLDVYNVVGKGGFIPRKMHTLDESLAPILLRALDKDPAERFPDAARFRRQLLAYLHARHATEGSEALGMTVLALGSSDLEDEWQRFAEYASLSLARYEEEIDDTLQALESLAQSVSASGARGGDVDDAHKLPDRARRTDGEKTRVAIDARRQALKRPDPTVIVRDRPKLADRTQVVRERATRSLGDVPTRGRATDNEVVRVVSVHPSSEGQAESMSTGVVFGLGLIVVGLLAAVAILLIR